MNRLGKPRRVVVIRTDKVGDLLLSMPAIRAVRRAFPSAHLTVLASPYNAPALRGWQVPDEVELYDPAWPFRRRWRVAQDIRRRRCDLAVVLHASLESCVVARLTGAPVRAGVVIARRVLDRIFAPVLLTDRWISRVEAAAARGRPVLHEVEMTRHILACIGIPWAGDELEIPLEPEAVRWADALVSRCFPPAAPLVGLQVSAKWLADGWTIGQLSELVGMIVSRRPDARVILTCGPADADVAARLRTVSGVETAPGSAGGGEVTIGWAGRAALVPVDFPRWAAVLARCEVVLSPATGAIHVAAALGRPVVGVYAVYRFAIDCQQFAPWRVPNRALRGGPFAEVAPAIVRAMEELLDGDQAGSGLRAPSSTCSS
jgi:heptosyltransferase-2